MRGIIALDIDGTLTHEHAGVPPRTVQRLHDLVDEGWGIIFITGRPFKHVARLFEALRFPYYVAPQNGALLIEMPAGKVVSKRCISDAVIPTMEEICAAEHSSFVIYAGAHCQDQIFWLPHRFPEAMRDYLERRCVAFREPWLALRNYSELPVHEFASVKCFGDHATAHRLGAAMEHELQLHTPVIDDPFDPKVFIAQGTHASVNKGQALKDFAALKGCSGPTIAAGDNVNDYPLLAAADIRIAMATAPDALRAQAHIIAPPASEEGILKGLEEACALCREGSL